MGNYGRFEAQISALNTKVTGSCLPLTILNGYKEQRMLTDCGLFQEGAKIITGKPENPSKKDKKSTSRKYKYEPKTLSDKLNSTFPFDASKIDYMFITHNHLDHTGRVPMLFKQGFRGQVYMSNSTKKLIPIGLGDSYKVLSKNSKLFHAPLLYTPDDIEMTLNYSKGCEYEEEIYVDKNIRLNFFMNGHVPGAVVSLVRISPGDRFDPNCKTNINILYTGDYCSNNMFFDVTPIPDWVFKLPIIIVTESTYGYMNTSEIQRVFNDNIIKATREKKQILIPVFSFGRAQEVAYTLRLLQNMGLVDKNYPVVFIGKTGSRYNLVYKNDGLDNREECKGTHWLPYNFMDLSGDAQRQQEILNDGKPKIVLATGGMGSHGPAQDLLPQFLPYKNKVIHFVGYCAVGTLGRKIYETWQGEVVKYNGIPQVEKNATVYFTNEFSKHAHQDELIHFLNQFENKLLVLTNHGEKESQRILAEKIKTETYTKDVAVMGSYLYRVDSHGLIASYPNKYYSNSLNY